MSSVAVLQPARGVDDQHVAAGGLAPRVSASKASPEASAPAGRATTGAPVRCPRSGAARWRRRAERVAGRDHHRLALRARTRLASLPMVVVLPDAVDADHQDDERLCRDIDIKRQRDGRQGLFDFGRKNGAHFVGRDVSVEPVAAQGF